MKMSTLLFFAVVVVGVGNTFAGGEYCMYDKFYFILLSNLSNSSLVSMDNLLYQL